MRSNRFLWAWFFIVLALTVTLALKPDYNWDMLPYMSIIKKMDGIKSFDKIHDDVYNTAKENLSAKKYNDLINPKDNYRNQMATDAAAFETQLPFFDIKPVYLIIVYFSYKLGVSLTYATLIPSLIAFFFMNIVSYFWCKKFLLSRSLFIGFLVLVCILTIPLAARSNPDGLACLFLLTSSFFFLETENLFLVVLFLVLSILTRPDNIIFAGLLYAIVLFGRWKRKVPFYVSAVYLLLIMLSYYLPVKLMSNPGWSALFYHAFIDNTANPLVKQTITAPLYLQVIRENVLNIKGIVVFVFFLMLCLPIMNCKTAVTEKSTLYKIFFIALLIWAIVKFSLFPMGSIRFLIPPFLLMIFPLIKEYELRHNKK